MKKIVLFIVFTMTAIVFANAQTHAQQELIKSFFRIPNVQKLIKEAAHPTCTCTGVSVASIKNNTVYVVAHYKDALDNFSCTYKMDIDYRGRFTNIELDECGNMNTYWGTFACFDANDIFNAFELMGKIGKSLKSDDPAVTFQKELQGKSISDFDTTESLCTVLLKLWYDEGYYGKY
jgi:hypothetical protein